MIPSWLKSYYGSEFETLNPSIVKEGKQFALVHLKASEKQGVGRSSYGYVIIKKSGNHQGSPYIPLAEGAVDSTKMAEMVRRLEKEDSK